MLKNLKFHYYSILVLLIIIFILLLWPKYTQYMNISKNKSQLININELVKNNSILKLKNKIIVK